jgi:hypothetical protein
MSLDLTDTFIIIKWPAEAGQPRYSFATLPHANEIQVPIERVQTCSTIEAAATIAAKLNAEEAAA